MSTVLCPYYCMMGFIGLYSTFAVHDVIVKINNIVFFEQPWLFLFQTVCVFVCGSSSVDLLSGEQFFPHNNMIVFQFGFLVKSFICQCKGILK